MLVLRAPILCQTAATSRKKFRLQLSVFYTNEMFNRHNLDTLPYPISPNDVHLYEYLLQMNINVFSFVDDGSRARHPLVISRKNYDNVANLLY